MFLQEVSLDEIVSKTKILLDEVVTWTKILIIFQTKLPSYSPRYSPSYSQQLFPAYLFTQMDHNDVITMFPIHLGI